jgi:hypothetical protein
VNPRAIAYGLLFSACLWALLALAYIVTVGIARS